MLHVRQNTSNPMPGEILNAPAPPRSPVHAARTLPESLLYSIFARIGGSGLDTDAFETLRASYRSGFLGKAIAYGNRQNEIPASLIHSLRLDSDLRGHFTCSMFARILLSRCRVKS